MNWNDWEGNRWFLTEEMSEYSFHTELLVNGEPIYINFVLACTAIQSMIIFVGAISVLDIDWRKRVRALFVALSLIHILNLFRNAGLIWLQMGYPDWRWMNLSIFEFGHAYAARFVSLGAMFLLALVLFEMLPQMHRNVLALMKPLVWIRSLNVLSHRGLRPSCHLGHFQQGDLDPMQGYFLLYHRLRYIRCHLRKHCFRHVVLLILLPSILRAPS